MTFKENCPDIRNTKVVDLIRELKDWGIQVIVHDPWASHAAKCLTASAYLWVSKEDLYDLDVVIVAVGHQEFRSLTPKELAHLCSNKKPRILADLKALYDKASCEQLVFTFTGRNNDLRWLVLRIHCSTTYARYKKYWK